MFLMFEGERLNNDDQAKDTEIEDMNAIDVHIR